jgi:predicted TIM-barrel fold metal-dependent hydrolase
VRAGTAEELLKAQADVNVAGAMIVQPVHHGFDHSYVTDAMRRYPGKFKASLVIDPWLSPEDAVAEIDRLHAQGWGGVRMKPGLWPEGKTPFGDETGRAVFQRCGELAMPIGILAGFAEHAETLETLAADFPRTPIILDHFGSSMDAFGTSDWERMKAFSKFDNTHVKVSGTEWLPERADEAKTATLDLMGSYGADRLMFGTDFPKYPKIVADGGYQGIWNTFDEWAATTLSAAETEALAGKTVGRLFSFDGFEQASL